MCRRRAVFLYTCHGLKIDNAVAVGSASVMAGWLKKGGKEQCSEGMVVIRFLSSS